MKRTKLECIPAICCTLALAGSFHVLTPGKLSAAEPQSRGASYQLDIPAQDLHVALQQLAAASRHKLLYKTALVAGKISSPLKGTFTAQEAVQQVLAGTDLTFEITSDSVVLIRDARAHLRDEKHADEAAALAHGAGSSRALLALVETQGTRASQAGEDADQPQTTGQTAGSAEGQLQEIVVTATKRAERVREIPMSIGVVTADQIEQRGLVGAEDYLRGMPGVNQTDSNVGPSVVIRGLETTTSFQNFASGSTVAMYFGETSTTNSAGITGGAGADLKLVDIERVEVLRGPQGTAFGSASLGGVVRIIPGAPKTGAFEGKLGTGYSVTSGTGGDNHAFEAVGNIPLIKDKLAIRAAAYRFEESGFYRNIAGSDATLLTAAGAFGAQPYATDEEEVGASTFTGARVAAFFQPTEDLKLTLTYVTQQTEIDGWAGSNRGAYQQAILRVGPEQVVLGQRQGGNETNIDLANAVFEYDLGWGNLLATYSHIDGRSAWSFPWTSIINGVLPAVSATQGDHSEHSGEIRIATRLDGQWNFLAGLYAEKLNDVWHQPVYWYGSTAASPFALTSTQIFTGMHEELELNQRAAFGEVSWQFLPGFKLTGGARIYEYDRTIRNRSLVSGQVTRPPENQTSSTNYRANLSYTPSEASLVYAGWAQGFRLGKPQVGLPSEVCDRDGDGIVDDGSGIPIASTRDVSSDSVDSYEVGGKLALIERRLTLDAAAFRVDWSEIPVQSRAQCGLIGIGYTANAGRARSEGVELQASFQATDAMRIDAGASWVDARLTDDVPVQGFRAGDRLPSPKTNASLGVQYAFLIGEHRAYVRADSIYVGQFYSTVGNRVARNAAGDYVKLDASMRVTVRDLNIDLFVRNLLNGDDVAYVLNNNTALHLRPRTLGVRLSYEF